MTYLQISNERKFKKQYIEKDNNQMYAILINY